MELKCPSTVISDFTGVARCHREIAAIEAELLAGNPDVAGLCLVGIPGQDERDSGMIPNGIPE